jgi:predicted RNase H-like HicB family nuclease
MPKRSSSRVFDVVLQRDENGLIVVSVPELPGCHTQAKTLDEAVARIQEAIELYLEEYPAPPRKEQFLGIQRVEVSTPA